MDKQEYLLSYFKEHAAQARQHETQRERTSSILFVASGVILAAIGNNDFSLGTTLLAMVLIPIGFIGREFCKIYRNRTQFHYIVMRRTRTEIEKFLDTPNLTSDLRNPEKIAQDPNEKKPYSKYGSLGNSWEILMLSIGLLGIFSTLIIFIINFKEFMQLIGYCPI